MKMYPDVTELLKQKAARRKRQAQLTFEEKIAIVNKWRKLSKQIQANQGLSKSAQPRQTRVRNVSG